MKTHGYRMLAIVPLVVALAALGLFGAEQDTSKRKAFMRLKLDHAQQVLEGIAVEDFAMISKNSQKISLLTRDESWQVLQTPHYREHSEEFRRAADAITDAARKKNLDAATLGYLQMTMHCASCHKYIRREMSDKK